MRRKVCLGSWAVQGAEHQEERGPAEALGHPCGGWSTGGVPGVRLEGPAAARSLSTPLITGGGVWLSFWGSGQGTMRKRGVKFYIGFTFNPIR